MDYIPTMKFASGFEIFEYCQKVAERYDIYSSALFHTTVQETRWMEDEGRWEVITDRGDAMRARFVIMANGILTQPKLAKIEGMDSFEGVSFHTSRWDYSHDLRGKKVGIIGTGATSVQAVPELAEVVDELYVFQRTPSSIDVRNQRETDVEQVSEWQKTPGWSLERRERFNTISGGRAALIGVSPATVAIPTRIFCLTPTVAANRTTTSSRVGVTSPTPESAAWRRARGCGYLLRSCKRSCWRRTSASWSRSGTAWTARFTTPPPPPL